MGRFRIGVIIDSFRTDIPTAVKKAAEVGAQGIQVYATRGEMAPENMNAQRIADFKALVADNGLVISALCGDLGGGFGNKEENPETSAVLKGFLDSLGSTGVGVNLDPANLVMVTGDDPAGAVYNLQKYIVHTHAKDGKQLYYKDPEIIYGLVKDSLVTGPSFLEVPLGEGQVPWEKYLNALEDIGYKGFLTIEREVGDDPAKDIRSAVEFLEKLG